MQPLLPWMRYVLYFTGCYNLLAGLTMVGLYHEMFQTLQTMGIEKPPLMFFVQLVGILVALFGVGYLMVAFNPLENRNVLLLGFCSKAMGSVLGIAYVALGKISPLFLVVLFFSDMMYLPPFVVILRRLYRIAGLHD